MKVTVVSKWKIRVSRELASLGFVLSGKPDIVACVGGDGTLLLAEQKFPGVPKLFIYHKCPRKCGHARLAMFFRQLKAGNYRIVKALALEAHVNGKTVRAINDINIHYVPPQALGLRVSAGNKVYDALGDGVVISTPFGSNAYFKSITFTTVRRGIGVAFNNPSKHRHFLHLQHGAKIRVKVMRHNGVLANDASPKTVRLRPGDVVRIAASGKPARFVVLRGHQFRVTS